MKRSIAIFLFMMLLIPAAAGANGDFDVDVIPTKGGDLKITFIGHATLMFEYNDKIVHVDPWTRLSDYRTMPKADLILVTHDHGDHLDLRAIEDIRTTETVILASKSCEGKIPTASIMKNGDIVKAAGFVVEAVPAYNVVHKTDAGVPYHPKGDGNGYIITFGDKKVYIAGDTENTPIMKTFYGIDIAFLPMNLPYTMTQEMVADAARALQPKILYPYHFWDTDTQKLVELLKEEKNIEVRIRNMQ